MTSKAKNSFGSRARAARLEKGFGLRQAARELDVSAAYLSRIENDFETPSGELLAQMAKRYAVPVEEFNELVASPNAAAAARGHILQSSAQLRALYRLGSELDATVVDDLIRRALKKQGVPNAQIEETLSKLKAELLPRITKRTEEGLFAAEVKPRFLTKKRVHNMAYDLLRRRGLNEARYNPPTPIEWLVETEPEVSYIVAPLKCGQRGEPVVLGQTRWNLNGERQITMNAVLADSHRSSDEHRFNFTLAHELFHAIEHLPRMPRQAMPFLTRAHPQEAVFVHRSAYLFRSPAERAVSRWTKDAGGARVLSTDEDWREWQCSAFASALLMPHWAVSVEFERRFGTTRFSAPGGANRREFALELTTQRMCPCGEFQKSMSDLFAVSRQAMAIRLLDLGIVEEV